MSVMTWRLWVALALVIVAIGCVIMSLYASARAQSGNIIQANAQTCSELRDMPYRGVSQDASNGSIVLRCGKHSYEPVWQEQR